MRFALLLSLVAAGAAQAHGNQAPPNPWLDGGRALFADPISLLLLMVLAFWLAQQSQGLKTALGGGVAGLATGSALALAGLMLDLGLALLALAGVLGLLLAWARPLPAWLLAAGAALAATGLVLMLAPAPASLGFRLSWLGGVLLVLGLVFATALGLLLVLLGRRRGPVKQMLLRVAGSWLATAALLAWVLELSRRSA